MQPQTINGAAATQARRLPAQSLKALWRSYLTAWKAIDPANEAADKKAFTIPAGPERDSDPEVRRLRAIEAAAVKKWEGLSEQMHEARADTLEELEIRLRHLQEAYLHEGDGSAAVRSVIRDLVRIRRTMGDI